MTSHSDFRYSSERHAENEPPCRAALESYAERHGYDILAPVADKYGVDCQMQRGGLTINIELERRRHWTAGAFPFSTAHVLERKCRRLGHTNNLVFLFFRWDFGQVLAIDGIHATQGRLKTMKGEQFRAVALRDCWTGPLVSDRDWLAELVDEAYWRHDK